MTESDLEEYRTTARTWLAANLERRDGPVIAREVEYYTPEVMATNRALQRRVFEAGYAGIPWPREYGGQGLTAEHESVFFQESADFVTPDFGILTGTTFRICVPTMIAHGDPDFLREFVPKVLAGEILVCQFFSEPSSGSDLASARMKATLEGDRWVLNGQKVWSTYAHLSDWGFCLARTDWDVPKHAGLSWFAVPSDAPGLTIRPIRQINETEEFCEDFFDDVVVPDRQRVGEVNKGWTVTQTMLVFERGGGRPAEQASEISPGTIADDLTGAAVRAGVLADGAARQKMARAHSIDYLTRVLAARLQARGRAGKMDAGVAAYGKLFKGTYFPIRARLLVEVAGPAGMVWDPADETGAQTSMAYLNSRIMSIAGGTNEMQRNAIGERGLGMPREPSFDTRKPFSQVLRDAKDWSGKQ
jgi:alkylation response protein AidB-like acyl-CoA dehydrogenase